MFSAYSWGDFIKFVIACLIPYYAFVLWKYYRHDFFDWLNNRGQKPQPVAAVATEDYDEEQDDVQSRFAVSNYDDGPQSQAQFSPPPAPSVPAPQRIEKPVAADWLPADVVPAEQIVSESGSGIDLDQPGVDMSGPDINQQPEETLGLPLALRSENPEELLLDDVMTAAKRIKPDENGRLVPVEANDPAASRLAAQINNQQGIEEFADMGFTR